MKKSLFLIFALVVVFFSACTKKKELSPEQVVKSFVELSASAKTPDVRQKLMARCSGEMRRAFERMTEEAFKLSYLSNEIEIKSFEILSSAQVEGVATIQYKVAIKNMGGTEPTDEVNTREVELVKAGGGWLLENIRPVGSDQVAFTRGMIF